MAATPTRRAEQPVDPDAVGAHPVDTHIWPISLAAPEGPRGLAFRIQGIGERAPRRPGLFIYAKKAPDGLWQALFVGESDNLRARLAFNEIVADAMLLGASDVHIRELGEPAEIRREFVDRLIATNAPVLNGDERIRFADILRPSSPQAKPTAKSHVA
jgi:hypothetical protein